MQADPSVLHSIRELATLTRRHWGLLVSGSVASTLGWLLQVNEINHVPSRLLLYAGFCLIAVAAVRAFHDVRFARDKKQEELDLLRSNQAIADKLTVLLQRGIHDVANSVLDPNDADDCKNFRSSAYQWLTELRQLMKECGCSLQDVSAVTDLTSADVPDPESLGYSYPSHRGIAVEKAMFAVRIRRLRRVIDGYTQKKVLADYQNP
jgi:hypothetical protein